MADNAAIKYQSSPAERQRKKVNRSKFVERNWARMTDYLAAHPCVDCGNADIRVLEFDHLDSETKMANVSSMYYGYTWDKIKAEIAKCDVVCANCHNIRTWMRAGAWRSTLYPEIA